MISQLATAGVRVPGGFATTAQAFRDFIVFSKDGESSLAKIADRLASLDIDDVKELAKAGAEIRQWIGNTFPATLAKRNRILHRLVADSKAKCRLQCVLRQRKICQMHPLPASKKLS
jgi:pyruvate,water dikinase